MLEKNKEISELGKIIRSIRLKKKLTLESLFYKNGLEPSTVSRIEKGLVDAKFSTLLKIAKAYDMKLSDLLNFM